MDKGSEAERVNERKVEGNRERAGARERQRERK